MKRIWIVLVLMLVLAVNVLAQQPLRPQDAEAAGVVKSLKWEYAVITADDSLVAADTTAGGTNGWVEVYTAEWLANKWSARLTIDSANASPSDSLSLHWSYQLYQGGSWSAAAVAGQILAAEISESGTTEVYALSISALAEKPYKIRLRCVNYGTGKSVIFDKLTVTYQ